MLQRYVLITVFLIHIAAICNLNTVIKMALYRCKAAVCFNLLE
jgi:hypothetical protein